MFWTDLEFSNRCVHLHPLSTARSSSGSGHLPFTEKITGSNPVRVTSRLQPKKNTTMANHKSALKRIRQSEKRRVHNKYYHKTTRNAVRRLRENNDKADATAFLPQVVAMLDKLAKRNIIHKNKASNLKSSLMKHVAAL